MRFAFPFTLSADRRAVMALGAYFDESGTDPKDSAMVFAGFISDEEKWATLSEKWHEAVVET